MTEKNIKSRIVHKHDLESNWILAVNFVPKQGELIVYDIEVDAEGNTLTLPEGRTTPYTYERFKIGDGVTLVNKLPFVVVQADWSVNDENDPAYIKNRPFYYEDNVVVYDTTFTSINLGGIYGFMDESESAQTVNMLADKTYTITFDGVAYNCVYSENWYLGNFSLYSDLGEDTGEPFFIMTSPGYALDIITSDTVETEHTVQIQGAHIKTLDKKYLPELPYVTVEEGNARWVNKGDFVQSNSLLMYKGRSYTTNYDDFMWFLTPDGIWNINLVIYSSAQTPGMGDLRLNYDSSTGTISLYWADENETAEITTKFYAFLRDVNTGAYLRTESQVQSVTIGTYTKKSHNFDFYINKRNFQSAEIVRSFDDYVETYSKDETDALLSVVQPKSTTVTIPAANWTGSSNPWSQVVTVNGVTANSKLDLQPTAHQIVSLQSSEITLMLQNDSGTVTAWAIGNKPKENYTMQVLITEVVQV